MRRQLALMLCAAMTLGAAIPAGAESGAGTFTGEAQGFGGPVTVTITTDGTSITDVVVTGDDETPTVGGAALDDLANQIKEAQSADIDGVSGASMTSAGARMAAQSAIDQMTGTTSEAAQLADGTYQVTATGFSWTGMISADVTIDGNKITAIEITEEHESDTGEMCQTAFDLMIPRLIENQSLAVDAVSGATATSNAIKSLVSQAIEQAGGNPADWQTPVEKSTETVVVDDYDVIVVGLGGSGILSYCAAAKAGATVFGVEKTAKLGGQSATTTGPMVIDSKSEVYEGVEFANPDDVYQTWIDYVGSEEKADIIHDAVYNSGAHLDFYMENFGFAFEGMIPSFVKPEWTALWTRYVGEDGTANLLGPNKTYMFDHAMELAVAMNEKNDYLLETTATELLYDGDAIIGVKAVGSDGTTYEIYGDSVILATGGYIGDEEMVVEHLGAMPNTLAALGNDGAGIKMGTDAGGATYMMDVLPMIHILQIPNLIKNEDLTPDQKAILTALALVKGETSVTINGEPLDETLVEAEIPGYKYYVVYSEDEIASFRENGLTENFATATSMFLGQNGTFEVGVPVGDIDEILEMGIQYNDVIKADSIADLAAQIGCDEATLSETLSGTDTTYYAVIVSGYTYGTVGGLDVDINMNVLREDGTPIENLFAVGTDSMGVENVDGKIYTPWGGQAQSWTFTSGQLGGEAAAAYGLSK